MEKVKLSVNLLEEDVNALRELAEKKGTTMTEILRQGIALSKFVQEARTRGEKLLIEDDEKTLRQIVVA